MIIICENVLARTLSPSELEIVTTWVENKIEVDKIKKALEISVSKRVKNLSYADKVLASLNEQKNECVIDESKSQLLDDFFRNIRWKKNL